MKRLFLSFSLLLAFVFSVSAYAADYSWRKNYYAYLGSASSADTGCKQMEGAVATNAGTNKRATYVYKQASSATAFRCYYQLASYNSTSKEYVDYGEPTNFVGWTISVSRQGDSCPAGSTYNSQEGRCDPECSSGQTLNPATGQCDDDNPCSDKVGSSSPFSISGNIGDSFLTPVGGSFVNSDSGCQSGCYGHTNSVKCNLKAGEPATYKCSGLLYFTGAQCSSGSTDVSSSDSPDPGPPDSSDDTDQNCTSWVSGPEGESRTCVSTSSSNRDGQMAGGDSPSPTPESSTDVQTDTTTKTPNADGGTTITTESNTTNTYCNLGGCTSTTTTNTTTTTTDASGETTASSSTCSGANCDGVKDGTGTGTGDSTGMAGSFGDFEGPGICDPSAGCSPQLDTASELGDSVPSFGQTMESIHSGISNSPIMSSLASVEWPSGGSCPTYSLELFGGSMSMTEHCDVWSSVQSVLSSVFLAIWAFVAIRVFMSA